MSYVYVFGPLGRPCKIGFSAFPKNRIGVIRNQHAKFISKSIIQQSTIWHLERFVNSENAKIVEQKAHELLDEYRIVNPDHPLFRKRCEWFDVDSGQAIAAVKKAMALTAISPASSSDQMPDVMITLRMSKRHLRNLDNLRRMEAMGSVPSRAEMLRRIIERHAGRSMQVGADG